MVPTAAVESNKNDVTEAISYNHETSDVVASVETDAVNVLFLFFFFFSTK